MSNCKNCGAPVNPEKAQCSYCGTYHHAAGDNITLHMDASKVVAAAALLTPNEARRLMGIGSPSRLMFREE